MALPVGIEPLVASGLWLHLYHRLHPDRTVTMLGAAAVRIAGREAAGGSEQ